MMFGEFSCMFVVPGVVILVILVFDYIAVRLRAMDMIVPEI